MPIKHYAYALFRFHLVDEEPGREAYAVVPCRTESDSFHLNTDIPGFDGLLTLHLSGDKLDLTASVLLKIVGAK